MRNAHYSSAESHLVSTLIGAIAGIVATGPMTAAMILWHRRLPERERYPLPPREITMKLAKESGVKHKLSESQRSAATLLAHFGYGAATGALYGAAEGSTAVPAAAKGIVFGLIVWTTSYLGLLPAVGVLTPATEHPARRNLLMIAAHVVWGLALGAFVALLRDETSNHGPQPFSRDGRGLKDVRRP